MKTRFLGLVGMALMAGLLAPRGTFAAEPDRNIMASGGGGTQLAIAKDIAELGNKCGMPVNVVPSKGSLENFFGVRNRHNTQFGIVDADILNYLNSYQGQNSDVRQAIQGMRIMFPLYDAKVLQAVDAGKRLGVGEPDGSAYLTSQLMFDILRIQVAERVRGSGNDMVELLRQGEIDALVRVGGAPLALLNDGRLDESFHIVPITDEVLRASYKSATLPAGIYPFQKTAVQTVSVKTLLMTYEYGTEKNAYYQNACKTVADFTNLIVDNIDELRRSGHAKWKDVNLTEVPKGWEVGMCVRKGLDQTYKVSCSQSAKNAENQEYLDLLGKRLKQ